MIYLPLEDFLESWKLLLTITNPSFYSLNFIHNQFCIIFVNVRIVLFTYAGDDESPGNMPKGVGYKRDEWVSTRHTHAIDL